MRTQLRQRNSYCMLLHISVEQPSILLDLLVHLKLVRKLHDRDGRDQQVLAAHGCLEGRPVLAHHGLVHDEPHFVDYEAADYARDPG
jgi:hypothetical protein